jgi:hypothetical protein
MRTIAKGATMVAATAAGVLGRRVFSRRGIAPDLLIGMKDDQDVTRWRVVTVNRKPEEVAPDGRLPEPLERLGDAIEVRLRPAPGGRGTELAARLRHGDPSGVSGAAARLTGDDPRQAVRSALREAKQLIETGEVLQADRPSSNEPSLRGAPLDLAVERAGGEGRL